MLLSRNLKKMAKNCHFYQRVWKQGGRDWLCFALKLCFLPVFAHCFCGKPVFHEKFDLLLCCDFRKFVLKRNIWKGPLTQPLEIRLKIEIESENESFSMFWQEISILTIPSGIMWIIMSRNAENSEFKQELPKNGKGAVKLSSRLFERILTIPGVEIEKWRNEF